MTTETLNRPPYCIGLGTRAEAEKLEPQQLEHDFGGVHCGTAT